MTILFCSFCLLRSSILPQHMAKRNSDESLYTSVISKVSKDKEVQWSLLSQCIECENDSMELLEELIKLWVTIRVFSITAMWVELYKKQTKTTTAKKPSLRKGLSKSMSDTD